MLSTKVSHGNVDAILETDSGCLVPKGKSKAITYDISIPDTISAPIIKGQNLGEVTYSLDGEILSKANIVAKEDVKKLNLINMSARVIEDWFTMFR